MIEESKPVVGYEKYYRVTRYGEVLALRNKNGKKKLKPYVDRDGYNRVRLKGDNKFIWIGVHKIVASAYLENPNNYTIVHHKNFIRNDNRVENLTWCSPQENNDYSHEHYMGSHYRSVLCIDANGNKTIYKSLSDAGRATNTNISNICRCCKGRTKRTGGYQWFYITEIKDE